jgi:hypothetical protein
MADRILVMAGRILVMADRILLALAGGRCDPTDPCQYPGPGPNTGQTLVKNTGLILVKNIGLREGVRVRPRRSLPVSGASARPPARAQTPPSPAFDQRLTSV